MTVLEWLRTMPVPPVLYHYTTQVGLLGILQDNCIWATAAHYLNDSSEYDYGLRLIAEKMRTVTTAAASNHAAALSAIAADLAPFQTICIVSLTSEGDLLSQWRAYAGKSGFALGFNSALLRQAAHDQGFYLVPCLYSEEKQRAAVDSLIQEFCERISTTAEWKAQDHGGCVASAMRLAVTLKSKAFAEEREWRLISIPLMMKELDFRPGASTLTPFYKFRLGEDRATYLHSVRIGPTPHPELSKASVRMLIKKLTDWEFGNRIAATKIPFRNW